MSPYEIAAIIISIISLLTTLAHFAITFFKDKLKIDVQIISVGQCKNGKFDINLKVINKTNKKFSIESAYFKDLANIYTCEFYLPTDYQPLHFDPYSFQVLNFHCKLAENLLFQPVRFILITSRGEVSVKIQLSKYLL